MGTGVFSSSCGGLWARAAKRARNDCRSFLGSGCGGVRTGILRVAANIANSVSEAAAARAEALALRAAELEVEAQQRALSSSGSRGSGR